MINRTILKDIRKYYDAPEAIIVTGMRRTGKTTLLNHVFHEIKSKNKIFLDLENPLNRKYFEEENYEQIKKSIEFSGIDFTRKAFVFLDEIQFVKNLSSVVKYFIDHYKIKFFLTGSVSFYLKNLFTESLGGRKYIFELFPFSFQEFLLCKSPSVKIPEEVSAVTKPVFDAISPFYEEYIRFGGFPQVVLKNSTEEKMKSLDEIFTSFFQMEVLQFSHFRRNDVIRDLMLLLFQRTGSLLDIQKLSKEMGVSRQTLSEYISFLEDAYFIKTIKPFSRGKDTEIRKMPKVFICDTGLANYFAKLDAGILFENSIFQNLRLKGKLNYYRKKSGIEIDFILNDETAYEIKIKPEQSDVKKTGILTKEINLKKFLIVSKNFVEMKNVIYGFLM